MNEYIRNKILWRYGKVKKSTKIQSFDEHILSLCQISVEEKGQFEDWIRAGKREKRNKASILIHNILLSHINKDISERGRERLANIKNALPHFEEIIISIKELEKKYYRDHLNHSIRVALLANAILSKLPHMNEEIIEDALIAGMVHDLGYPISGSISKSYMRNIISCYSSQNFSEMIQSCDPLILVKFGEIIKPSELAGCSLIDTFEHGHHEVLGSLEFFELLNEKARNQERYRKIVSAILLHDTFIDVEIKFSESPLAVVLIIADELQEWGRPAGSSENAELQEFSKITISSRQIQAFLDYTKNQRFSCLRQLESKTNNLQRLVLDDNFPAFEIGYKIQNFASIKINDIVRCLGYLCNFSSVSKFTVGWYEEVEYVTKIYPPHLFEFKFPLPKYSNDEITIFPHFGRFLMDFRQAVQQFKNGGKRKANLLDQLLLLFVPLRREALVTPVKYDEFYIRKDESGHIKTYFFNRNTNSCHQGKLFSMANWKFLVAYYDTSFFPGEHIEISKIDLALLNTYIFLPFVFWYLEKILMHNLPDEEKVFTNQDTRFKLYVRQYKNITNRTKLSSRESSVLRATSQFLSAIDPGGYFIFLREPLLNYVTQHWKACDWVKRKAEYDENIEKAIRKMRECNGQTTQYG